MWSSSERSQSAKSGESPKPLAAAATFIPPASDSAASSTTPGRIPVIADHELLRIIGRGAYGEVWLARHTRLNTLRAVKIVRRDNFSDARPFQREFAGLQKYEPISRGHPNLMAILHVGGTDDCFYCVMELADDANVVSEKVGKRVGEKLSDEIPLTHSPTHYLKIGRAHV